MAAKPSSRADAIDLAHIAARIRPSSDVAQSACASADTPMPTRAANTIGRPPIGAIIRPFPNAGDRDEHPDDRIDTTRTIRAPRGNTLTCKSWLTEARSA
jgi:hypothetical protein